MYETSDMQNEVQELTWALVDEQAGEGEIRRLEELLLEDREARRVYILCMQLHADLHYMFSKKKPGLPPALLEAMKAEATKTGTPKAETKSPPLPIVDLQFPGTSQHHSNGFH